MLKNDTLKNGTSRIGLYGSAPPPGGVRPSNWSIVFLDLELSSKYTCENEKCPLQNRDGLSHNGRHWKSQNKSGWPQTWITWKTQEIFKITGKTRGNLNFCRKNWRT